LNEGDHAILDRSSKEIDTYYQSRDSLIAAVDAYTNAVLKERTAELKANDQSSAVYRKSSIVLFIFGWILGLFGKFLKLGRA
jgi:hypothetical protein